MPWCIKLMLSSLGWVGDCRLIHRHCQSSTASTTAWDLTPILLVANLAHTNGAKNLKNDRKPGTMVFIWEYLVRAIQWIPTWQGFDGFQKYLQRCALDKSSLSIGRVNPFNATATFIQDIRLLKCLKAIQTLPCQGSTLTVVLMAPGQ